MMITLRRSPVVSLAMGEGLASVGTGPAAGPAAYVLSTDPRRVAFPRRRRARGTGDGSASRDAGAGGGLVPAAAGVHPGQPGAVPRGSHHQRRAAPVEAYGDDVRPVRRRERRRDPRQVTGDIRSP